MKVIFFLPAGTINWDVPADMATTFQFNNFVAQVRANGFFASNELYIRHEALVGMAHMVEGQPSPEIVAGMTKQ